MSLQWTPIRRRGSAVVRARQDVQTLEHQTRANVLLAFKLSMVSGQNGGTEVVRPNLRTVYRKMADIGVQVDGTEELSMLDTTATRGETNIAVAEINTQDSAVSTTTTTTYQPNHHPLVLQSSTSSEGSVDEEERERPRQRQEEEDVNAICVQQTETCADDDVTTQLQPETNETDGVLDLSINEDRDKDQGGCLLECVTFTVQCCECTIL